MKNMIGIKRLDYTSSVIKASPEEIFQAYLDPRAAAILRSPLGMKGTINIFEPWERGKFSIIFNDSENKNLLLNNDIEYFRSLHGCFLKLQPNKRIVEIINIEASEHQFIGTLTCTINLLEVTEGTEVVIICENVPIAINPIDHIEKLNAVLKNLAAYIE